MNEVKKVILFLLCCAIPFSFYAQKARQNAATKKWGYEQTENKGWWENSKYRGNSMFGEWDAALVNQDYEINWLISPQYEEVTKRFTEKLAGVVLGGKVGFIDIHNRFIIKPQFENVDDVHGFNLGLSAVKKNGKFGFINKKGENFMFNFDEKKVYADHLNGVNMIPQVEKVVDKICEDGYKNIFLVGIGGTLLYAGQIFHTARQLGCSLPLYLTNATDFLYEGDANFTKDSVVVVASLSGHTVEVEQAIDKAHEVGARVIGYVEVVDTPIANKVDELVTTVGGEYYWWYTVVLRFMKNAGQFDKYDELVSDMQNLPKDIVQVYKDADAQMKEYADKYCDSPLTYVVASGNLEDWAHCYGMCIMEEMQWMRTRPISAANFFHGLLEVIERDTTVLLIKGEDKTRPEMDRVENFVGKICANVTTIDTKNFELPGIRDEFRGILSPIVMRSAFMRLNVHLEHNRRHPLDIRRYYKCLDY